MVPVDGGAALRAAAGLSDSGPVRARRPPSQADVPRPQAAMLEKHALLADASTPASLVAACRICTWVTWVEVLPFLCLLVGLALAGGYILEGLMHTGPSFFALLAQTWAFHRGVAADTARARADRPE